MARLIPRIGSAVLLCGLCACPRTSSHSDSGTGGLPAPEITSITPNTGPAAGGTDVTVRGSGFRAGVRVFFGGEEGVNPGLASGTEVTVTTPSVGEAGIVEVRILNTDGQSQTLKNGFTFTGGQTVTESLLRGEAALRDQSGATTVMVTLTADVEVPGLTSGAGLGQGLRAQAGFQRGPVTGDVLTDPTWVDATYAEDADGKNPGDKARDRYSAQLSVPGGTGMEAKEYLLVARFSLDGVHWVLADRDGSANGFTVAQLPRLTVSRPSVDWCKLGGEQVEAPPALTLRLGQNGPAVYAQVFRAGVTAAAGQGAGVKGQLGYGPLGVLPTASGWTWTDAAFHKDTGGGANDEYRAVLPNPGAGTFSFAYRFNLNDGPYVYCDANGSDAPGYTADQAGSLTVTSSSVPVCRVTPLQKDTVSSGANVSAWARVWKLGVTEAKGAAPGVLAQVGIGAAGTDGSQGGWTWRNAAFLGDVAETGEDEYQGDFQPAYTGSRAVGFRFSFDAGASWLYCDLNGSDVGGYEVAQQPSLNVTPHADLGYCVLQHPPSVSATDTNIYGQVWEASLTPPAGEPVGMVAELGYGSAAEDPGVSTSWKWVAGGYGSQVGNNDEFVAQLGAIAAGSYDYVFRFARSAGAPFCYGDLDGQFNGNGFSGAAADGGTNLGRAIIP